jgi:hypothetical protein
MADTVSKLYAEIGFKVNQDGLKQAQKMIQDMAKQMSAINNATKEAAKQYGIFSKNRAKQSLADAKLETENTRRKLVERRIDILNMREYQRQKDRDRKNEEKAQKDAYRERVKTDKLIAKHEEEQNKQAHKYSEERTTRLKNMLGAFRNFAIGVSTAMVALGGFALGISADSRKRMANIRDFQFATGVGFEDLQKYRNQFNVIGAGMKSEDIMEDLANLQQNLVSISLGKGKLSGFKLAGVRAAAGMGNSVRVIEELRKVAQEQDVDNATLINIMKDMGFKNAEKWLLNLRSNAGTDSLTAQTQISAEQASSILQSEIALRQFNYAVQNAKDQLSALFAPFIIEYANKAKQWIEKFSLALSDSNGEMSVWAKTLKEGIDVFLSLLDVLGKVVGLFEPFATLLAEAVRTLGEKFGDKFANWMGWEGNVPESLKSSQDYANRIIEYGKSGKLNNLSEFESLALFNRDLASAKNFYENWARGDAVKSFNTDRRNTTAIIVNSTDNSVQNVTLNANGEDDFIQKVADTVKSKERVQEKEYSVIKDLFVMSNSSGNVSVVR